MDNPRSRSKWRFRCGELIGLNPEIMRQGSRSALSGFNSFAACKSSLMQYRLSVFHLS